MVCCDTGGGCCDGAGFDGGMGELSFGIGLGLLLVGFVLFSSGWLVLCEYLNQVAMVWMTGGYVALF